jgi:ribosomal protein S18 acetylase RimI-like enzyme
VESLPSRELLALYDAQMRANPPPEPGMAYELAGGVLRGTGNFNFIFHSDLTASSADAAIAEQARQFSNPPRELQWKVYDHDQPFDIAGRLLAAGFQIQEPETFMVLRLSDDRPLAAQSPGIEIRRVSDHSGLGDYVGVGSEVFGSDESWRIEAYSPRLDDPTLALYVAYDGAKPVSSGRLEMPKGRSFASLWGGGTLEAYRGRGIYKALVDARAREAARAGFAYLTVDARDTSRPILERLGFACLTRVRDFVLNKAAP